MNFFETLLQWLLTSGIKIIIVLLIAVAAWMLVDFIIKKFFDPERKSKLDPTLRKFLKSVVSVGAKCLIVIVTVSTLGVNTSSFVALIAAAGATVGLALQGGLSNLAGGIILIVLRPFKIGDYISAAGQAGNVTEIGLFYTTCLTLDNQKVFIPNGSLTSSSIVNVTAESTRRVDLNFAVPYDTDIKKVKSLLTRVAAADERVLKDPAIQVVVAEYKESAIIFQLRMWTNTENYWGVHNDMQETVREVFNMSEIEVPYQKIDVLSNRK